MRIIYLHQYFNTPSMSGGTRSYEMGRRLAAAGHEVDMITSVREDAKDMKGWRSTKEGGMNVHWFPVPYSNKMSYTDRIKAFFSFAWEASLKAASIKADVIFATSTPLTIAIPGVYASWRQKIPMVFEVRDLWPELPIAVGALKNPFLKAAARYLEKWAYGHSKKIVALSPGMKEGVVKTGYAQSNVTVIPNSCDLELFSVSDEQCQNFRKSHHWLGSRPLVLYCGTIGLINGVDYFVLLAEAVLKMDPEARFLVVGEGREEKKVKALAQERSVLGKNFFMFPQISKKDIPVIVKSADIATSLVIDIKEIWHNSANKFFDALAAGTPVGINHGGWQADILTESGAGVVLDARDINKAAQQLLKAVHDKEWLRKAREAAALLARDKFSRDLLAKKLESVLVQAVKEDKHG